MQREKRVVHRVDVLARDAAFRALRVKGAAVAVRRDAERGVVLQRVVRAALPRLRCQQLLPERLQCQVERRSGDRAVSGDGDTLRLEPGLAERVGPRASLSRLDVDGAIYGVE